MWKNGLLYHVIFALAVVWPAIVICRRAGVKPLWAATLFVPIFGVVIFSCALAFQPWPHKQQVTKP
ncbi:MAG TPA: hypothetical protein VGF14_04440 [Alphaproteobacteria bacterium]